jgi:hypothetical protein
MICFIFFVRLSFSILALKTCNPVYLVSNKGVCDRSAKDAYIFATPDPTFAFRGACVALYSVLYFSFRIMIAFYTL